MSDDTPVFVFTGGPCAGKTTGLCYVEEKLRDLGYHIFIIKEAATELLTSGIATANGQFTEEGFQGLVVRRILEAEKFYKDAARLCTSKKKVILCDRGILDGRAYMDEATLQGVLASHGLSIVAARDERYDAVFHLRSAAIGAEEFYSNATNAVRRETLHEARGKDRRTLEAWLGHPHLRVIDNSTDFPHKMKRLLKEVLAALGVPVPVEIERKFLVAPDFDPRGIPVPFQEIDIEQAYLSAPDGEAIRVRRRGQNGSAVYYHTHKKRLPEEGAYHSVEVERHIEKSEYEELFSARNPSLCVIRKKRYCFVWKEQYFELDAFLEPSSELRILEVELTEACTEVLLPDFVPVIDEMCDLTNEKIARGCPALN